MPPRRAKHWIILSYENEYKFDRITKQKSKVVHWDAGLNIISNNLLSQMQARDRVLFISISDSWNIEGELQVYKAPYPDPRQTEDGNSKYYSPDNPTQYYRVPMKYSRKFKRQINWNEITSSSDPILQNITKISLPQSVYEIDEPHYRCILFLQKTEAKDFSNEVVVEEISAPVILEEEITGKEPLGSGQFGQVYRAKFRHKVVAVKELYVNPSELTDAELKKVQLEVNILRNTHNPHIITFFGACITQNHVTIVTELLSKGELGKLLSNNSFSMSLFLKLRMARDIAVGMNWLHSSKPVQFLHRDLKPSNLLVDDNYRIKICDFGFCEVKDPALQKLQAKGVIGTLMYMAPEVLENKDFSEKIDVYSFGLILWEIYTREKLLPQFGDADGLKLKEFILNGGRPIIPDSCPYALKSIMERSWHHDPDKRPSFNDIVVELSELMFESCIECPLGRDFWRKLEYHGVTEIEWNVFKKELKNEINEAYENQFNELPKKPTENEILNASDYQLNAFSANGVSNLRIATKEALRRYQCEDIFSIQPDIEIDFTCLHKLLNVKENNGKVTLKKWGDILRWFGPIIDDNGFPGFLNRITRTLRLKCFHGNLSEEHATNKLKDSAIRSYLVRFSSKPGYFVFSYVSPKSKNVVHRRIQYSPNSNCHFILNDQKFYSLQIVIDAFIKQKYFDKPINCTDYESIFEKTESNYLMDNTEVEFLDD